ncbi:MAG: hypothetical protein MK033_04175 [Candidatus Caenarcaniphilales bacterium]|nr:hypothetical protein [Candidatus Caenarcaniphilales bacterium]
MADNSVNQFRNNLERANLESSYKAPSAEKLESSTQMPPISAEKELVLTLVDKLFGIKERVKDSGDSLKKEDIPNTIKATLEEFIDRDNFVSADKFKAEIMQPTLDIMKIIQHDLGTDSIGKLIFDATSNYLNAIAQTLNVESRARVQDLSQASEFGYSYSSSSVTENGKTKTEESGNSYIKNQDGETVKLDPNTMSKELKTMQEQMGSIQEQMATMFKSFSDIFKF